MQDQAQFNPDSKGALDGIKVIDLSRVLAGPLCTQNLSDQWAIVIKVEPPTGDETRHLGPPFDPASGLASYFNALNRGKKSIGLDLNKEESINILHHLLSDADILVENFLPQTMERWGIGYEQSLAKLYPKLIYCSISGFGETGPLGGLPGYDAVLQAMCGIMSVNGDTSIGSTKVGIPIVDQMTGYVALSGILMALFDRTRTGKGQRVEATLYDSAINLLIPQAANWMASGQAPQLMGSSHSNIAPYDKYKIKKGEVFIAIVNNQQFEKFCKFIKKEEWIINVNFEKNSARNKNKELLKKEIEKAIYEFDIDHICEELMRVGVPAATIQTIPQALNHPHSKHRNLIIEKEGYRGIRSPILLSGTNCKITQTPPSFSEHRVEILKSIGFTEIDIQRLESEGISPSKIKTLK
jgi:crotonobetainyl-CoA:carnitine CoA-transferase CaiB-like acyl-CoA transferase